MNTNELRIGNKVLHPLKKPGCTGCFIWLILIAIVLIFSCTPLKYTEATLVGKRIFVNDISTYVFLTDRNEVIFKRSFDTRLYDLGQRYEIGYRKKYTFIK